MLALLIVLATCAAYAEKDMLLGLHDRANSDPNAFIDALRASEFAAIVPMLPFSPARRPTRANRQPSATATNNAATTLPLVFMHGMGDSCFNNGMKRLTEEAGVYLDVYSVCVPTGADRRSDTMNGFFLSMDASVDVMAEAISADPHLAAGFNCVGLSQGNNLCRGYIQKYNTIGPAVNAHLSIHGPVVGVAALPGCGKGDDALGSLCQSISATLSKAAYTARVQDGLFQAGYFRDAAAVETEAYMSVSEIGTWNGEDGGSSMETVKSNFLLTNTFAMVQALGDTVVVPREGEWWGAYAANDYSRVLAMNETAWYKEDTFGLRSADEDGRLFFESTAGDHLEFSDSDLYAWLDKYCR